MGLDERLFSSAVAAATNTPASNTSDQAPADGISNRSTSSDGKQQQQQQLHFHHSRLHRHQPPATNHASPGSSATVGMTSQSTPPNTALSAAHRDPATPSLMSGPNIANDHHHHNSLQQHQTRPSPAVGSHHSHHAYQYVVSSARDATDHASPDSSTADLTAQGGPDEPPRKRRRPALSCEPCRRRKVRCDRMQPCSPCVRMGVVTACEYDNRFPRPGLPPGSNEFSAVPSTPAYRHPQDQSDVGSTSSYPDFENEVRKHVYPSPAHSSSVQLTNGANHGAHYVSRSPVNGHAPSLDALQREVRELRDRLFKVESQLAAPRKDTDVQETVQTLLSRMQQLERQMLDASGPTASNGSRTGLSVSLPAPRVKTGHDFIKFWGPMHYFHLYDAGATIFGPLLSAKSKFDAAQDSSTSPAKDLFYDCRKMRQAIKDRHRCMEVETLQQVLESLPRFYIRDRLVECYFSTFELIHRLFHAKSFRKLYVKHAEHLDQAPECFVVQLLLVMAIGSVFMDDPTRIELRAPAARWIYAAQGWLTGTAEKTHANEDTVLAWTLLVLARRVNSTGTKEQNYTLAGSMVRSALALGLHRDPKHIPNISEFRAELRRRLWSAILEISLGTAIEANTFPHLSLSDFDCEPASDVPDSQMDDISGSVLSGSSQFEPELSTLMRQSYGNRLEIVRILNDFSSPLSYDKALQLSAELDEASSKISDFFDIRRGRSVGPQLLHHNIITWTIRSTQLALHSAFLRTASKDQRFRFAQHKALECAMVLITSLGTLDPKSFSFDDTSKLALVGGGLFKAPLSLKALTVVCKHLEAQTEYSRGPQSSLSATVSATDPTEQYFRALRHASEQCLNIIRSGDPSCKRYAYLNVTLAMIESVQAGNQAEDAIPHASWETLQTCRGIMMSHLNPEQVQSLSNGLGAHSPAATVKTPSLGGFAADVLQMENVELSFDPSWLLTAWNTGCGQT